MGIGPFSRSQYDDSISCSSPNFSTIDVSGPKKNPNPNPQNFNIVQTLQIKDSLIVDVVYPDCTNYEGHKILVYRNTTIDKLTKQGTIDPHFSNNKTKLSPFARFEPTPVGWQAAVQFATIIQNRIPEGL